MNLRVAVFIISLALWALLENLFPRLKLHEGYFYRLIRHLSLLGIAWLGALLVGWDIEVFANWNVSLFPAFLKIEMIFGLEARIFFEILFLDFSIYVQHLLFHRFSILWRFHGLHHSDPDFDSTTAIRFHPIEIWLSLGVKLGLVLSLGISPIGIVLFEMILNSSALFNHANLKLPQWLDKALQLIIVTPDMHRIHHSILPEEMHSNFGFFFSFWDRIFKTFSKKDFVDQEKIKIGIKDVSKLNFWGLLIYPFVKK